MFLITADSKKLCFRSRAPCPTMRKFLYFLYTIRIQKFTFTNVKHDISMSDEQLNKQFRESFSFVLITYDATSVCYVIIISSSKQNAHSPPQILFIRFCWWPFSIFWTSEAVSRQCGHVYKQQRARRLIPSPRYFSILSSRCWTVSTSSLSITMLDFR